MSNEKNFLKPKNQQIVVKAEVDLEIQKVIETELKDSIEKIIAEASQKYYRNINVKFSVNLD